MSTLPSTLDETYERILLAIEEEHAEYALRILTWLVFSARPLFADEIAEVVAIDVDRNPAFDPEDILEEPLDVLKICSSLITATTLTNASWEAAGAQGGGNIESWSGTNWLQDSSGRLGGNDDLLEEHNSDSANAHAEIVRALSVSPQNSYRIITLSHHSVKEYLLSDRAQKGEARRFSIQSEVSNELIAKSYLSYLFQLSDKYFGYHQLVTASRLAQYSAENWACHTRAAGPGAERMKQMIFDFLLSGGSVFFNAIRICNPDAPTKSVEGNGNQRPLSSAPF